MARFVATRPTASLQASRRASEARILTVAAELDAAALRGCQGVLSALRDHSTLLLGNHRYDADGHLRSRAALKPGARSAAME
jgi:hypothetical protein